MNDNPVIPDAAVEALARILANEALFDADIGGYGWDSDRDSSDHFMPTARKDALHYLEAAAPHMLAGVTALADAWEARGEHDMKVAKIITDGYIATEVLGHGAQMVENARHIRNAIGSAK